MKLLFFSMLESKYRGGGEEVAKCLRLSIRVGVKNWKILVHVVYGCPQIGLIVDTQKRAISV